MALSEKKILAGKKKGTSSSKKTDKKKKAGKKSSKKGDKKKKGSSKKGDKKKKKKLLGKKKKIVKEEAEESSSSEEEEYEDGEEEDNQEDDDEEEGEEEGKSAVDEFFTTLISDTANFKPTAAELATFELIVEHFHSLLLAYCKRFEEEDAKGRVFKENDMSLAFLHIYQQLDVQFIKTPFHQHIWKRIFGCLTQVTRINSESDNAESTIDMIKYSKNFFQARFDEFANEVRAL